VDYGLGSGINASQVITNASNLRTGDNPSYTAEMFLSLYPQFAPQNTPTSVVQIYIDLANVSVKQSRWRGAWEIAMGLFVAHFVYLWVRDTSCVASGKDGIISAGQAKGITTSESVDGVSYSADIGAIANDLEGFADWKSSAYGMQLATMAKMYGKGGMCV
jgi:hypothetical protein